MSNQGFQVHIYAHAKVARADYWPLIDARTRLANFAFYI